MRAPQQWITVHLKDGTSLVSLYDSDCFVSTDPNERDLYVSNVHNWTDDGKLEQDKRVEGMLLRVNSIERIEFHGTSNSQTE